MSESGEAKPSDAEAQADKQAQNEIADKSQVLFMRVFMVTAVLTLIALLFYGPSLQGTTTVSSCIRYSPYRDYRGQRRCIQYGNKEVSAGWNIMFYLLGPLFAGVMIGMIVKCANYPSTCRPTRRSYRYHDPYYAQPTTSININPW